MRKEKSPAPKYGDVPNHERNLSAIDRMLDILNIILCILLASGFVCSILLAAELITKLITK